MEITLSQIKQTTKSADIEERFEDSIFNLIGCSFRRKMKFGE